MIEIKELDRNNAQYLNKCDEEFTISSFYDISFIGGKFELTEKAVTPYKKKYESTKINVEEYLKAPAKTVLFAFADGKLAGEVILEKNWNNYARLEIAVIEEYRRKGIGKKLMEHSINWTRLKGLPGIMAETQNTNVPACKFYKASGFSIGGIDTELYKGVDKNSKEIAIFWYYEF